MTAPAPSDKSIEQQLLERLREMADAPAAAGLVDDVAHLGGLVLTHDTIAEGVHYRPEDPPESVGWKLVAVNLSDLAAKGAEPTGALLSLAIGDAPDKMLPGEWEERFLAGVAVACESYDLPLLGGDTIALPEGAPRVLGMTAIGKCADAPKRDGGQEGDVLLLVGTLGDAMAGLALLAEDEKASGTLVEAYRRPVPLLAAGRTLALHVHAMMDVSDGLLLDAARMAQVSGLAVEIDLAALPLSDAYLAARGDNREARLFAATGGDDYALLAAIHPEKLTKVTSLLPSKSMKAVVGRLVSGTGISLRDGDAPVELPERLGHEHRPQ
ncbi:thiamine-phosphate kinase [Sphingomicrobium sediminis]|uniref:Thiamine-monophosphate kinase n=1 Tax=Sphingomicrobium sediminis TaxID=2950949 RepID=A0A9X2J227_9SPHN|nr:thiamine-phosphate kinase [Sphingomicrobium sediminis]MCM8557858.1 thiamine-phosphate kinase [Sphingomicrobium sediminis]